MLNRFVTALQKNSSDAMLPIGIHIDSYTDIVSLTVTLSDTLADGGVGVVGIHHVKYAGGVNTLVEIL